MMNENRDPLAETAEKAEAELNRNETGESRWAVSFIRRYDDGAAALVFSREWAATETRCDACYMNDYCVRIRRAEHAEPEDWFFTLAEWFVKDVIRTEDGGFAIVKQEIGGRNTETVALTPEIRGRVYL